MSGTWRDHILAGFTPGLSRLTLVADPEDLLADEGLVQSIRSLGYDIIEYEDPVAFRYIYESQYRSTGDQDPQAALMVVVRGPDARLEKLPYDLLRDGRSLSTTLGALFPGLTYNEVIALDRNDFDALYKAQAQFKPGVLGVNAIRDFILRHVYGIAPELIHDEAGLLALLLRLHISGRRLPEMLVHHLDHILQASATFNAWSLRPLISDKTQFFHFLQERWPVYLDSLVEKDDVQIHETAGGYTITVDGPLNLPFGDSSVRMFVDNLFLEGKLHAVTHPLANKLRTLWVSVGLLHDPKTDQRRRLDQLLSHLEETLPSENAHYKEWLAFVPGWAEAILLYHRLFPSLNHQFPQFDTLKSQLDHTFLNWMMDRFKSLVSLPPRPPVVVHHIPRYLAVKRKVYPKLALIVLDGMTYDQWLVMRPILQKQLPDLVFREGAVFAWIPTLTSISRQAIFAGQAPMYFPGSIYTTAKEQALGARFWENHGLSAAAVGYSKALRSKPDLARVDMLLSKPKMQVIGLVVDQVDQMIHGMKLGMGGLHQQVRYWVEGGFLSKLLQKLWGAGFHVYHTADHGNVEAKGIGGPAEGSVADIRGQRVRLYPNETLRNQIHKDFSEAVAWSPDGLPPDFFPLLAPGRSAFVKKGATIISHGGISVEEVIVPLVKVEWLTK